MNNDDFLIEKTIELFESDTGWGDSNDWSNQDFVILSEKIQERTGVALSHVTLKRVWGKVKYDSVPNTHTLDTLVQFLGYEYWRDFKSQIGNRAASTITTKQIIGNGHGNTIVDNRIRASRSNEIANQEIVKGVYTAYEKKDWNMLKALFANDFTFNSPNDDHIDLRTYRVRCWPNAYNIKKFDIDKLTIDGEDAFVTYNGWTTDGSVFRNTEYFKLVDGKIKEISCFFGPVISFPKNKEKRKGLGLSIMRY
jgi:SnoaL-like domain